MLVAFGQYGGFGGWGKAGGKWNGVGEGTGRVAPWAGGVIQPFGQILTLVPRLHGPNLMVAISPFPPLKEKAAPLFCLGHHGAPVWKALDESIGLDLSEDRRDAGMTNKHHVPIFVSLLFV